MTLGNIIILSQRTLDRDLEHEIIHIEQYRRRPFIHPLLYFYESYKRGYVENKYEKEAYQKAKNKYLGKDIQLP